MTNCDVLPIGLADGWTDAPPSLLGSIYEWSDRRYMFVKATEALAGGRALKWTSRALYTVEYADDESSRVCGVTTAELLAAAGSIAASDYFVMQIAGRAELVKGDDAAKATVAGEWVAPDDDADQGKMGGVTLVQRTQNKHPSNFKTEAGLTLTAGTTPTITQNSNKELIATWANTDTSFAKIGQFRLPADYDSVADYCRLVVLATKAGTTDNRTIDAEVYKIPAGGGAVSADLNPTAVSLGAATITNPTEKVISLSGNALVAGDVLDVQLSITNPGNTDAATIVGVVLEHKSVKIPDGAFAVAIDAVSATDAQFTARLIADRLEAA